MSNANPIIADNDDSTGTVVGARAVATTEGHDDSVDANSIRTSGSTAEPAAALSPLPNDGGDENRPKLESRPSFQLREEWPENILGQGVVGGRSLVVCTVDVQLLTGKARACAERCLR